MTEVYCCSIIIIDFYSPCLMCHWNQVGGTHKSKHFFIHILFFCTASHMNINGRFKKKKISERSLKKVVIRNILVGPINKSIFLCAIWWASNTNIKGSFLERFPFQRPLGETNCRRTKTFI